MRLGRAFRAGRDAFRGTRLLVAVATTWMAYGAIVLAFEAVDDYGPSRRNVALGVGLVGVGVALGVLTSRVRQGSRRAVYMTPFALAPLAWWCATGVQSAVDAAEAVGPAFALALHVAAAARVLTNLATTSSPARGRTAPGGAPPAAR